ncbi:MAG: hypothetical protein ACI4Q6_06990, partial [Huintestinicola sp.]
ITANGTYGGKVVYRTTITVTVIEKKEDSKDQKKDSFSTDPKSIKMNIDEIHSKDDETFWMMTKEELPKAKNGNIAMAYLFAPETKLQSMYGASKTATGDIISRVAAAEQKYYNEGYDFNGKHYEIVTGVTAEQIVIYNKQTISENGLDDPWELYQEGKWNWDTFTSMLESYVDPEADCYGLDGYWAEKALFLSAGVPSVQSVDGTLKVNLLDPTVEKAQNWMYDLYNKGLVINREIFDWAEQPQFMGEGKELFYIIGSWAVNTDPDTWTTKIPPENLGIAPVPSPAGSDPYQSATLDGWVLCKGAANPMGVVMYGECTRLAAENDEAIAIADQKLRDDAKWSDELIAINKEINKLAEQYPVVDLATGISTDVASITTDGGDNIGLRAAMHGTEWATNRDQIAEVVEVLVQEVDDQLKAM